MKGHTEYEELLALAALDAADAAELRSLDAHLAACDECRAELRSLSDAAAALALAVPPVEPSPELRARLLATLKATSQGVAQRAGERERDVTRGADTTTRGANVISLEEARRAPRRLFFVSRPAFAFAAVAATLLVAALTVASVVLWERNAAMRSQLASLSDTLSQMRGELARAREQGEILTAPAMRTDELAATKLAGTAVARITYDMNTGRAVFVAANLPAPPAGREYQLWYIADGKPLPGSAFTTDAQGRAEVRATVPPAGRRAQVFAVTLEPAGGMPAPTGEMYLKSKAEG